MSKLIPNFFIVGAAKAGTTSLYYYLNQHPNVYMSPIKEPHFFCKDIRCKNFNENYRKNSCFDIKKYLRESTLKSRHIAFIEKEEEYLELFRERKTEKILGEASTGYLYSNVAAKEIYNFNPNSKIIIMLRNPVERAFSHWLMDLKGGATESSFIEAINRDYKKSEKGWGISHLYVELGLYYEQVKRYMDLFPDNNLKILLYEDFKNNNTKVMDEIFNFLEVRKIPIERVEKNKAGIPKNNFVTKIKNIESVKRVAKAIIPESLKQKLNSYLYTSENLPILKNDAKDMLNQKFFNEDIYNLSKLINRDLSAWT